MLSDIIGGAFGSAFSRRRPTQQELNQIQRVTDLYACEASGISQLRFGGGVIGLAGMDPVDHSSYREINIPSTPEPLLGKTYDYPDERPVEPTRKEE